MSKAKRMTQQSCVDDWMLGSSKSGTASHMRHENGVLFADELPVARKLAAHSCVLMLCRGTSSTSFNPHMIATQLGITVEQVLEMRSKSSVHAISSAAEQMWNEVPHGNHIFNACQKMAVDMFRVRDVMTNPVQDDADEYKRQIVHRLQYCHKLSSPYRIRWIVGDEKKESQVGSGFCYTNLATVIFKEWGQFKERFGFTGEIPEYHQLMEAVWQRVRILEAGGFTRLGELKRELLIPDNVPWDEVIELSKQPEMKAERKWESGKYVIHYKADPMVRKMLAAPLREKYGTRGERKARV